MDQEREAFPDIEVLIDNVPGNVYRRVRRPDGAYVFEFLSPGLFTNFGIDHRRLLAQRPVVFDWVHPDDRARFIADLEVSATTLGLLDHRVRVIGIDGSVHWARGIARPSRRADGSIVWDGIVIDVTREIEAEAALRVAKDEAERAHQAAAQVLAQHVASIQPCLANLEAALQTAVEAVRAPELNVALGALGELKAAVGCVSSPAAARRDGRAALDELTPRQREIARLVGDGHTNKAIAAALGISPGTVKLHISAVFRELRLNNRADLVGLVRSR